MFCFMYSISTLNTKNWGLISADFRAAILVTLHMYYVTPAREIYNEIELGSQWDCACHWVKYLHEYYKL